MTELPDECLVTMRWVRENFVPRGTGDERDMTARELAREFGHSPDWWQDRARLGEIPGSYQRGERSKWYIPRQAATVFLREIRKPKRRGSRRGWKGPQEAGRGRPAAVQEGALLGGGSSAVAGGATHSP